MIVKNEAHVLRRCLDSVLPFIDTWVLVDTGSTDGTQALIRDYFANAGKPGELFERPWKDFGSNRSEALTLAKERARYTFIIDADEVFEVPQGFKWPALTADCYQFLHRPGTSDTTFWLPQLVRSALPWRYVGVLHEALACDTPHRIERLKGPLTQGHFDSARNALPQEEKYRRDALVLEQALETEPDNARYVFYLAQSWRDAREPEKALLSYRRRTTLGGWEEEVWYAQLEVAKLLERLGRRGEAIEAYLEAHQRRPQRAEALCELARLHREAGAFAVAHLFAAAAKGIPRPDDILFIDEGVYRWRALDEYAVAAYWLGHMAECAATCARLLSERRAPESERARITANQRLAQERLPTLRKR